MSKKLKFKTKKHREKLNLFPTSDSIIDTDRITGAHIEMFSNRQLILDGCLGVFEYSENYIKLNIGKGTVILCGTDFDIVTFENKIITVKGKILSVEFCV